MKLYILADRLNKSLDEVFKAIEKLNLNIKSAEQKPHTRRGYENY